MKQYEYIPFPELRRQYRHKRRIRKMLTGFIETMIISAAYGIAIGLMLTGMWITF